MRVSWLSYSARNRGRGSSPILRSTSALLLLIPVACSADGLIGGECKDGYAYCDDECISITDDEANCGGCDIACGRVLACVKGLCGGEDGDITLPGGGSGDGGNSMGGLGGEGSGDSGGFGFGAGGPGGRDSGGSSGSDGGSENTGGAESSGGMGGAVCAPPFSTPAACGDCDTQCGGDTPRCSPDEDGDFECVANCLVEPYLTECSSACVNLASDAKHCGECGNACPSEICVESECVGKTSGHMVALCMSFERRSVSQTSLLANSVFLSAENPVRILAYTRDTLPATKAGTNYSLTEAAADKNRSFEITEITSPALVQEELNRINYDVFLIYDQEQAGGGELAASGASWRASVELFTGVGGIVVVLTGGEGISEMHELISELGIFTATDTTKFDASRDRYYVQAPGDAVGINVISPFRGVRTSCTFSTTDVPTGEIVYVTSDSDPEVEIGNPGVVHHIVVP